MIIGHKKQLQFLKRIVDSGKIPHALLFSGQEKLGKKRVALEFISWLFGCLPINHPDFILIQPNTKANFGGGQIQIDQIRELIWRIALKPFKSKIKAAIIDSAHSMTKEAQNCFLKTLEEPKGDTLLILISEYPNFLLPTILSRCQIIKFYPVKREEIKNYLIEKDLPEEKIEKILEISLGKPGLAIDFLENQEKLKEREEMEKELIKISNLPLALRFQYAKELQKSSDLKEILNIWLAHFRKILISQSLPPLKVKNILNLIQRMNFLISTTNVNQRLALEILMLEL